MYCNNPGGVTVAGWGRGGILITYTPRKVNLDAVQGFRAAVAVSCPLAYPAHQAELEKRTLVFCGWDEPLWVGCGWGAGDQQKWGGRMIFGGYSHLSKHLEVHVVWFPFLDVVDYLPIGWIATKNVTFFVNQRNSGTSQESEARPQNGCFLYDFQQSFDLCP